MHDGLITIKADGRGQMDWPGVTGGQGDLQAARITVRADSQQRATAVIDSGSLTWINDYGPGSTFTISTTSFGLNLSRHGTHIWFFCTRAEQEAGKDQQYCGS
jgi:hypothetical protein